MAKQRREIELKEEVIEEITEQFLRGYSASSIKSRMIKNRLIRYDEWGYYEKVVKERITSATDIYDTIGRNIQLMRLNNLLVAAHQAEDNRLLLDINKELDRILSLYTQKVQLDTTTYELEL